MRSGIPCGPGRPPKEHQFKPGQSGNPKGARRKPRSIAPDLKALFERALSAKVTLRQGEQAKIITKAAAGIEQLVNQFAKGDRHARRDLFALAESLGVDLVTQGEALEQSVAAALSAKFVLAPMRKRWISNAAVAYENSRFDALPAASPASSPGPP